MKKEKIEFGFEVYDNLRELSATDQKLLREAQNATKKAYAPYSKFFVGAAALLSNGRILSAANQENASFPVSICAERALLSTVSSLYPDSAIDTFAVSYRSKMETSGHPISPCGMCRQALQEFEARMKKPIRLLLYGSKGNVIVIPAAGSLLPLPFTSQELPESID